MKSRLGTIATGVLLALPVSAVTPLAAAQASAGCVTRDEFRRADPGTKMGRVHDIFDTRGIRFYYDGTRPPTQSRAYDRCGSGQAAVYFEKRGGIWRVQGRSWTA